MPSFKSSSSTVNNRNFNDIGENRVGLMDTTSLIRPESDCQVAVNVGTCTDL